MEDEFTECSTGILVDIEDKPEEKLSMTLNIEPENYVLNGLNLNGGSNRLLGADLSIRRDVFTTPKGGWKTPSPKSMKMINREAFRIIDQLHSSPIETIEAQLIDEDFPTPFSLDGSTSDSSPEPENTCKKNMQPSKNCDSTSKVTCSTTSQNEKEFSIQIQTESLNGVENESSVKIESVKNESHIENEKESTIQNERESTIQNEKESTIQNEKESTIQNEKESTIQNENESTIQNERESTIQNEKESTIQNERESTIQNERESTIQNERESTIQNERESTLQNESELPSFKGEEITHKQVEVPACAMVSPNNTISAASESESVNKNELRTPVSSKLLGKENLSIKKDMSKLRFTNNSTGFMKKNLMEPNSFIRPISTLNGKASFRGPVKKEKAIAVPDKATSSKKIQSQTPGVVNRRNSILPQLASTMPSLPGPSGISALSKASKLVTPVPKMVRRTQSFQSESRKYAPKNNGTVSASLSSKNFLSGIGSIKKDSNAVVKSRLSICQIPSTAIPTNTPVCRSKSFPKSSGTLSSRISRPSLSASRKIDSAVEPSRISDPDRSILSTSSRIRFTSRLFLPSPLPDSMNMNLSRKLFSDVTPSKKR